MKAKFSKKEAIVFGWNAFKKDWKFLISIFVAVWAISAILGSIVGNSYENAPFMGVVLQLISYIINAVIALGVVKIMLGFADSKKPNWRDLYKEYRKSIRYIIATVLYAGLIVVGLILFVIPGIYFAIKYQFYAYFIVDKNLGVIESLKKSSQITRGSIINLLFFGLICVGLSILGLLTFGLGLLITIPIVSVASAHVFRKLEK